MILLHPILNIFTKEHNILNEILNKCVNYSFTF